MNDSQLNDLAAKLALLIAKKADDGHPDVREALGSINQRLDRLEASGTKTTSAQSTVPTHPSLDKFGVAEAIVDSLFAKKDKACTFEPSKPCDHCSMCNSRGF